MKKLAVLTAVGVLSLPTIANAQLTINVDLNHGNNYSGTAIAPDLGIVWNDFSLSGRPVSMTISDVSDSLGNALSGVDVTLASADGTSQINRYNDTSSSSPNPVDLMSDYSYGTTFNVTVSGLPTSGYTYDVYAYLCGNNEGQAGGLSIATLNGGNGIGNFDYVTATGSSFRDIYSGGGEGVSYLVFHGLSADGSGQMNMQVDTYMNGFQLVQTVPEPSTFALAGFGLLSLLLARRRR